MIFEIITAVGVILTMSLLGHLAIEWAAHQAAKDITQNTPGEFESRKD